MDPSTCSVCLAPLRVEPTTVGSPARCPACGGRVLESRYAIVRTSEEPIDPAAVRDALVESMELHPIDSMLLARRARPYAVIADGLDRARAGRVRTALRRAGLETISLPSRAVPWLPRPQLASRIEWLEDRFFLAAGSEEATLLPPHVRLLALGVVRRSGRADLDTIGGDAFPLAGGLARSSRRVVARTRDAEPWTECWVVSQRPDRVWRLVAGRFTHAGLVDLPGETPSFRDVLSAIHGRVPTVRLSDTFGSWLLGRRPGHHEFESDDAFAGYVQSQWMRLRLAESVRVFA